MGFYIGPGPVDNIASTQRTTQKYIADGSRYLYYLSEQVPGAFESNIFIFINSILQEPETAYLIENAWKISGTISGSFTLGETVTGVSSGSTAIVTEVKSNYIHVADTSDAFIIGETVNGNDSLATMVVSGYTKEYGHTLHFLGTPEVNDSILAIHLGSSTYQLQPSSNTVGTLELKDGAVTQSKIAEDVIGFTELEYGDYVTVSGDYDIMNEGTVNVISASGVMTLPYANGTGRSIKIRKASTDIGDITVNARGTDVITLSSSLSSVTISTAGDYTVFEDILSGIWETN